jgi:hypothetical protein
LFANCHPERSIRKISAPSFGALNQFSREPKDPQFSARTTTNLKKRKNSVILSEASAKSARRFLAR